MPTLGLSPASDDTLDVGRNAPARQADRVNVRVERQRTIEVEQSDV